MQEIKKWFYNLDGEGHGPLNTKDLLELLSNKSINANTPVWKDGMSEWQELKRITELQEVADKDISPEVKNMNVSSSDSPTQDEHVINTDTISNDITNKANREVMGIFHRLLTLIIVLYISGKWLGLTAWWVIFASMIWAEGFIVLLVPPPGGGVLIGIQLASVLVIPLVILSVFEWVVFGKLTWSYKSFEKTE